MWHRFCGQVPGGSVPQGPSDSSLAGSRFSGQVSGKVFVPKGSNDRSLAVYCLGMRDKNAGRLSTFSNPHQITLGLPIEDEDDDEYEDETEVAQPPTLKDLKRRFVSRRRK
jgi:hypothetical protein